MTLTKKSISNEAKLLLVAKYRLKSSWIPLVTGIDALTDFGALQIIKR